MGIRIIPEKFDNGGMGYTVSLSVDISEGEEACLDVSVQDYLNALNEAILSHNLFRARGDNNGQCQGCDVCCGERMPLTLIDLIILAQNPRVMDALGEDFQSDPEKTLAKMIKRFCRVYVKGDTVDITLRLADDGKCPFLNRQTKTCSLYDSRPFVCQAYICCPASNEALKVRQAIVNAGEDELVRWWLDCAQKASMDYWYDEADNPRVDPDDWQRGPFSGKTSYDEVLLKEILSPELLARLWEVK